jgi:hypothetical protein
VCRHEAWDGLHGGSPQQGLKGSKEFPQIEWSKKEIWAGGFAAYQVEESARQGGEAFHW